MNPVKYIKRISRKKLCNSLESEVTDSHIDYLIQCLGENCRTSKHLLNWCIIVVFHSTGITVPEISQLRINDVFYQDDGPMILPVGYGEQRRFVTIRNHRLREILWVHIQIRNLQLGDYLFIGNKTADLPYHQASIYRLLKRSSERAGVPHVTVKALQLAYQRNCLPPSLNNMPVKQEQNKPKRLAS